MLSEHERLWQAYEQAQTGAANGDPDAMIALADFLLADELVDRNPAVAAYWLERAAHLNRPAAAYKLGRLLDAENTQPEEIFRWFLKAAEGGHADAFVEVGDLYRLGNGTDVNVAQATYWLSKASDAGDDHADDLLAELHDEGEAM